MGGIHTSHTCTRVYSQVHMCVSVHTSCGHARANTRACMKWLTRTPHKPRTRTPSRAGHAARGEEPRSCCDSDVGKVTSPSTAGRPQESVLGKRRKRAVYASPPASGVSCSLHSGGSCPSLVPVHGPDTPQLCNWSLFCHFHLCGITVQLQIPRAHKP